MNHIFRTVWNHALGAMVAVSEAGAVRGGSVSRAPGRGLAVAPFFRLNTLSVLVAIALVASISIAYSAPVGGVAVVGQMRTSTQGKLTTITTQNGTGLNYAAINWQSFSIPQGTSTYFLQPSSSSTVINRVVTSTPSQLFGTLGSNGHLVLVNQSGITVGAGAVVDTAGFTASALKMSDADALAGRMRFGDGSTGGTVSVRGQVLARSGDVVLVGSTVDTTQDALIQAPNGSTILAAGNQVEITGRGLEGIAMTVQAPGNSAVNLGTLRGDAVAIFAGTLRHSGAIQATQATLEGGRVVLKAAGDATVDGNATIAATGTVGGRVDVLGQHVGLTDRARIDVSGANGGGQVRIGGDYQGKNAAIANAQTAYVGQDVSIRANATDNGNGGRVIVWSDDTTRAYGAIEARGGALGGHGGFVETSGHRVLSVSGMRVDTRAAQGAVGTWLLDPADITITHAASSTSPLVGGVNGSLSSITDADINAALNTTDVTISTSTASGTGTGNITFDSSASAIGISNGTSSARTLNLNADSNIVFAGANGTTFKSLGSTSSLQVMLNVSGSNAIVTNAGSSVTLDGSGTAAGSVVAFVPAASPAGVRWRNDGTLNINGKAQVHLGAGAVLKNSSTGMVNAASTTGWAFYSSANDDGIIQNDGILNVTVGTAFEAEYNQSSTGALNIHGVNLNLQNAHNISGLIDLAPIGATAAGTLNVNENHGLTAAFSNTMLKTTVASYRGAAVVNVAGTVGGSPVATFDHVNAADVAVNIGTVNGAAGNVTVKGGGSSNFYNLVLNSGNFTLDNSTVNISMSNPQNPFTVLSGTGVSYIGNVGYTAAGSMVAGGSISTTGNLTLKASGDITLSGTANSNGGNILLEAGGNLSAGTVYSYGGNIDLHAANSITGIATNIYSSGGGITLRADTGSIGTPGYGYVYSSGGSIDIHAATNASFASLSSSGTSSHLDAGAINLKAGGVVSVSSLAATGYTPEVLGEAGNGGNISIIAMASSGTSTINAINVGPGSGSSAKSYGNITASFNHHFVGPSTGISANVIDYTNTAEGADFSNQTMTAAVMRLKLAGSLVGNSAVAQKVSNLTVSTSSGNVAFYASVPLTVSGIATNGGSVTLGNTATAGGMTLGNISTLGGALAVNAYGGITVNGSIATGAGAQSLVAHSPITVGGNMSSSANISLSSMTNDSSSNITLLSGYSIQSSGGSVNLSAYNNINQYGYVYGATGVSASTSVGAIHFGLSGYSGGSPLSYSQAGTSIAPPLAPLVLTIGAALGDTTVSPLDTTTALLEGQLVADATTADKKSNELVTVEGQACP